MLACLLSFCKGGKDVNSSADSIDQSHNQGVKGTILFLSGNHMPSVGAPVVGDKQGVKRKLVAFPLLKMQDLTQKESFFQRPSVQPVDSIFSSDDGSFKMPLPSGSYTLMVEEKDNLFYANQFDGKGNVFPVDVKTNIFNDITFKIDYNAAY